MLWVKAFHVIAVICWFAGLFYLPRLFVYHAMCEDEAGRERFKIMERKLYRGIMTPSMVLAVLLGLWTMSYNFTGYLSGGWMHLKLTCVALLLVYHFMCWQYLKAFRDDRNTKSHKYFRIFNELPVLLLIVIVLMAVVKPF
ncbi:MAG: protoporphyrinogen oxidase HemJ [Burkholderiaceae bacterium]|jgi:putative membrane protein|nr:protoporphyrinogen oxidase HemJ [Burkholderiaceae bacterium]